MPSQYDNPKTLKEKKLCLNTVSKNLVEGELRLTDKVRDCTGSCKTIKLFHTLGVLVKSNDAPCDSKPALKFDGKLEVRELVTEEINVPAGRGIHAGNFVWTSNDGSIVITGVLNGFNNIGPHRKPFIENANCAQDCQTRLVLEGRLCGKFKKSPDDKFKDCEVLAAYRLRLSDIETAPLAKVNGTLEGVLVCPCVQ